MRINSTERVIQEKDICILIQSSCELNPLLLSTAQVYSSFTYLSLILECKKLQVLLQSTGQQHCVVLGPIHGAAEQDVLFDGATLDPCGLGYVCNASCYFHLSKTHNSFTSLLEKQVGKWKLNILA